MQGDAGLALGCFEQGPVQIGAVDGEIRRPPALLGGISELDSRDLGQFGRRSKRYRLRRDCRGQQPVEDAEPLQDAGCVGRELQPRADLLEGRCTLEQSDLETALG